MAARETTAPVGHPRLALVPRLLRCPDLLDDNRLGSGHDMPPVDSSLVGQSDCDATVPVIVAALVDRRGVVALPRHAVPPLRLVRSSSRKVTSASAGNRRSRPIRMDLTAPELTSAYPMVRPLPGRSAASSTVRTRGSELVAGPCGNKLMISASVIARKPAPSAPADLESAWRVKPPRIKSRRHRQCYGSTPVSEICADGSFCQRSRRWSQLDGLQGLTSQANMVQGLNTRVTRWGRRGQPASPSPGTSDSSVRPSG